MSRLRYGINSSGQSSELVCSSFRQPIGCAACRHTLHDERFVLSSSAEATATAANAKQTVPLKQYQRALVKAKAYHMESRQLASQLRRMAARAAKLKKAAQALRWADGHAAGLRRRLPAQASVCCRQSAISSCGELLQMECLPANNTALSSPGNARL